MQISHIDQIRGFNRFYTNILGLLDKHLLNSSYTLAELRVMFEIHKHKAITSKAITELLKMDKGYLSRTLMSFEKKRLIERKNSELDGRIQLISLSQKGTEIFLEINRASENQIMEILTDLTIEDIQHLIDCMNSIEKILRKIAI